MALYGSIREGRVAGAVYLQFRCWKTKLWSWSGGRWRILKDYVPP